MTQMNLSMQKGNQGQRIDGSQVEAGGRGLEWEFGISRCKLVYIQ